VNIARLRCKGVGYFSVLLLVVLATSGCGGTTKNVSDKVTFTFDCMDQTVHVDKNDNKNGVKEPWVYVCEDKTVTWDTSWDSSWDPQRDHFKVHFKNHFPFKSDPQDFTDAVGNNKSKGAYSQHPPVFTIYEYTITVNGKDFDPQVVGGGGHSN
jgi:hypothetical protein